MIREIFRALEAGAMDALHTYATLIALPFTIARGFANTVSKRLHWF